MHDLKTSKVKVIGQSHNFVIQFAFHCIDSEDLDTEHNFHMMHILCTRDMNVVRRWFSF